MSHNIPDDLRLNFIEVHTTLNGGETNLVFGAYQYHISENQGIVTVANLNGEKRQEYASAFSIECGNTLRNGKPLANTTPRQFVQALRDKRIVVQRFNDNQFVIYEIIPERYKFKRLIVDEVYSTTYECYRILGQRNPLEKPQVLINRCLLELGLLDSRIVDKAIFTTGYTIL